MISRVPLLLLVAVVFFKYPEALSVAHINKGNADKLLKLSLFTRENTELPERLYPGISNSLMRKRIGIPIKIIIHGWMESGRTSTITSLKRGLLDHTDLNVIAVDWMWGSRNPNYFTPVANTKAVGEHVGALIESLISEGAKLDNIHIIGHSLGAHVAGFAGAYLKSGKVSRITGLDPALPAFDGVPATERLDSSDAQFVDVIHTNGGLYGIEEPIGHADFYPNGGRRQPGCLISGMCSHKRSVDFFVESIDPSSRFPTLICHSVPRNGPAGCKPSPHDMGFYLNSSARGLFYTQTNSRRPFSTVIPK